MSNQQQDAAVWPRRLFGTLAVLVVVVCFFLPYLWMVVSGLKNQDEIFRDLSPFSWRAFVPSNPSLDSLRILFGEKGVGRALINSLIVAAIQVGGSAIVCSLAAYALTRIHFRGRGLIFAIILATFMLPSEALVVPLYGVIAGLNLQDSLVGVALPWVASVFGLFLLKQSFEEVPRELDEAAKLDGAGHFRVFLNVILPNVKTALTTLALVIFLFSWNAFLWPLVVVQTPERQVIQVAVAQSVSPGELPNWSVTFAGAAVATVPLLILFLIAQRHFVRGIASTGIK